VTEIRSVTVEPLDLPLTEPFEISLGVQHEASNLLVTVETDGATGRGEGSPLPPVTGETREAAVATAEAMADLLEGREVADYRAAVSDLRSTFPATPSAAFAVETALLDAYCRERGVALSELFGGPPAPVETDLTIPIVPAEKARDDAERAAADGFDHLKIKTGTRVREDVERVVAAWEGAPDAALKVDANQGWTPKETARFADRVAERGVRLELIEQPVPRDDLAGLARATERVDVPVAADEAVFTPADAVEVVRREAADVVNAKLGKSGPLAVAELVAIAEAADLELMVGCMLESAVGIHTSAHLVAGTGAFDYVDLDGNLLIDEDVIDVAYGPTIEIGGPGHGVAPE